MKEEASKQRKGLKATTYGDVDKAVCKVSASAQAQNIRIGGAVLLQNAKDFASLLSHDFQASSGWPHKSKALHSIVGKSLSAKSLSGESSSADTTEAAAWIQNAVLDILARYDDLVNVYNADEMALLCGILPNCTPALKGDHYHSGWHSKLQTSPPGHDHMDGNEKRLPLVIGCSKKLQYFKNSWQLEITYATKKFWMSHNIFYTWLEAFEEDIKDAGHCVPHP